MGGGRKKEIKFKTVEIPIVLDMDSELDVALFEYIHKQPNLLAYNSRIKSFLAQDVSSPGIQECRRLLENRRDHKADRFAFVSFELFTRCSG